MRLRSELDLCGKLPRRSVKPRAARPRECPASPLPGSLAVSSHPPLLHEGNRPLHCPTEISPGLSRADDTAPPERRGRCRPPACLSFEATREPRPISRELRLRDRRGPGVRRSVSFVEDLPSVLQQDGGLVRGRVSTEPPGAVRVTPDSLRPTPEHSIEIGIADRIRTDQHPVAGSSERDDVHACECISPQARRRERR